MVLPLANDDSLMNLYLQSLSTDLIAPGAKDTAGALREIEPFLENQPTPGTILFITYGIERRAFPSFSEHAGNARDQILVLGVGTTQGGPLRSASGQFVAEEGRRLFSKLDLEGLRALKDQADIPVSTITLDDDDMNGCSAMPLVIFRPFNNGNAQVRWVDQGYWLVIPVALLTALGFRRGWMIRWTTAGFAALFLLHAPTASARDFHFIDLWLTPDQQGRYYYQKGDYATAAERFQDPMWKGMALCREKDYEGALNQFALVDSPESWFNQGNALAYLKKYPEAVKAYTEALKQHPHWREAEENLALIRSLIPPPPKKSDEEEARNFKPDQIQFDDKAKRGKKSRMNSASRKWLMSGCAISRRVRRISCGANSRSNRRRRSVDDPRPSYFCDLHMPSQRRAEARCACGDTITSPHLCRAGRPGEGDCSGADYFVGEPEFPQFNVENAIVVLPQETPENSNETIDGQTFAGIGITYLIYPQQPGRFKLPPAEIVVKYASNPPQSTEMRLPLPTVVFEAVIRRRLRILIIFCLRLRSP